MVYVKEIHGGTFRRVALSGLLDSLQKVKRESAERKRELALKKQASPVRLVELKLKARSYADFNDSLLLQIFFLTL